MDVAPCGGAGSRSCWAVASAVDWGTINVATAGVDAELLMMVRRAALRAARRTVGLSHLLSALASDSLVSALLARELHDSWKHFHALRCYLEVAEYSPAITESELDRHRQATPDGSVKRPEDAAARITRLVDDAARDGVLFGLIRSRALDPALARLAERIAADRQQHSLALARYLSESSELATAQTA